LSKETVPAWDEEKNTEPTTQKRKQQKRVNYGQGADTGLKTGHLRNKRGRHIWVGGKPRASIKNLI